MKKFILSLAVAALAVSMTSCFRNDETDNGNNSVADDIGNAARDTVDDIDRAGDAITDGTMFDTDNNYNVDEYTANGTEMK